MKAITELEGMGYTFKLDGGTLRYSYEGEGRPDLEHARSLLEYVKRHKDEAMAFLRRRLEPRPVLEVKADLEALLDEMAKATGQGDDVAERLLARWDDLNGEYGAAVGAALECIPRPHGVSCLP